MPPVSTRSRSSPIAYISPAKLCCCAERAISRRGSFRRPNSSSISDARTSSLMSRPLCSAPPKSTRLSEAWVRKWPTTSSVRRCKANSPGLTFKVLRFVDASRTFVNRRLRIRAQRPGAVHLPGCAVRCHDRLWCFLLLDPLLHRSEHIESIRTFAAGAMPHAWHHEQAHRIVHLANFRLHALVVIDAVLGRNQRIGP